MTPFRLFQSPPDLQGMQVRGDVQGLLAVVTDPKWEEGGRRGTDVRPRAVSALVKIGTPQAVQGLVNVLRGDFPFAWWRTEQGIRSLMQDRGRVGTERVIQDLLALIDSGNTLQASYAAHALAVVPVPEALMPIIRRLNSVIGGREHGPYPTRVNFIEALRMLRDPLGEEPIIEALRFRTKDKYDAEMSSMAAAEALGYLGDYRAVQPLVDILINPRQYGSDTGGLTSRAREALIRLAQDGRLRDPRAVPPLTMLTHNKNPEVANIAVRVLGECGNSGAVDALVAALERRELATTAAQALFEYRDPRSTRALITATWSAEISEPCARWLAHSCTREDVGRFIACVKRDGWFADAPYHQRRAAAWMLAELYQSGLLDESFKRLVLAQKKNMSQPHTDRHDDYEHRGSIHYEDYSPHTDRHSDNGIGVELRA